MTWEMGDHGILSIDGVTDGLLRELAKEEAALFVAELEFGEAEAKFEVASRKYAAVRDMVTKHLGYSPYIKPKEEWPHSAVEQMGGFPLGDNRFIHMKTGDAVVAMLKETREPVTLEEIVKGLRRGGIRRAETILTRKVNAALMRTSGIEKTDDGKYWYQEPEPDEF